MIDFQKTVDSISAMTCVVSVKKLDDGSCGKFRLVTGNRAYIDSIEKPAPGTRMLKDKFVPNTEYTDYLTRDLNFEDFCYGAAVQKKCLHAYANPDRLPVWFNMTFLPLYPDEGNLCYCLYIMEINFESNAKQLSNISSDVATSVLETCIKLRGATDFRAAMTDVIKDIGELCGSEHCCILTMNTYDRTCEVLCEALSENTRLLPMGRYVDDKFYDIAESWEGVIAGSNCLIAKNEHDMEVVKERNPVWYASLTGAGAKNIVLFPLKSNKQLLGYIWAINFNAENALKIKETLEITTFILGSELGNYLLVDRLRVLSSKDMLTGVMNRNEMNNYVDLLSAGSDGEKTSVGVIFADLNGLKTVNDVEGHSQGDTLLKDAANALREVFAESEIFRAGGDEFTIIVTGVTQEELDKKVSDIRTVCTSYNRLIFAIGSCVEDDSRNVRRALKCADERMYEDKKKYYEQFPEKKRR